MIEQHFKNQVDSGTTMFFYGLERLSTDNKIEVSIRSHKGTLDTFPTTLEYVRHLSESMPLFKEQGIEE